MVRTDEEDGDDSEWTDNLADISSPGRGDIHFRLGEMFHRSQNCGAIMPDGKAVGGSVRNRQ
jgi:hypothetical protein